MKLLLSYKWNNKSPRKKKKSTFKRKETPSTGKTYTKNKYYKNSFTNTQKNEYNKKKERKKMFSYYILMKFQLFI